MSIAAGGLCQQVKQTVEWMPDYTYGGYTYSLCFNASVPPHPGNTPSNATTGCGAPSANQVPNPYPYILNRSYSRNTKRYRLLWRPIDSSRFECAVVHFSWRWSRTRMTMWQYRG